MPCKADYVPAKTAQDREINLPEGVPALRSLYLYIAGACNLACRHCWISPTFNPNGGGQFLPFEYIEQAVQQALPLGLGTVKLTGGEPLLHPRFRDILALLHRLGLPCTIETNGTLLDRDMAEFMKQHGVRFVSVSVDGATPETHDNLRMVPGSFHRAVTGLRALVETGYPAQLICTLHQDNVAELVDVVTLGERLGCASVKFNHVQRAGRGERFGSDKGFSVEEIIALNNRIETEIVPNHRISVYFDVPLAFQPIRRLLYDSGRCTIQEILGILTTGEISLCGIGVTVPELVFGHLATEALYDVWCQAPVLKTVREQIPDQLEGICHNCLHRNLCQGHCIAHNYHITGQLNAPFHFCEQADRAGLFPITRKRDGAAPVAPSDHAWG